MWYGLLYMYVHKHRVCTVDIFQHGMKDFPYRDKHETGTVYNILTNIVILFRFILDIYSSLAEEVKRFLTHCTQAV